MTVLKSFYHQAHILLSTTGLVIPMPGATDGSYIVAGVSNSIHIVFPGKGSALHCDKACLNRSPWICAHVLQLPKSESPILLQQVQNFQSRHQFHQPTRQEVHQRQAKSQAKTRGRKTTLKRHHHPDGRSFRRLASPTN